MTLNDFQNIESYKTLKKKKKKNDLNTICLSFWYMW